MKIIAGKLNIENDTRTYSGRHSYASSLMRTGAPIALIQKSLGHSNVSVTERYLASFEDEQIKEASRNMLKTILG